MPLPDFNQTNLDSQIAYIKAMSQSSRASIVESITNDLQQYLLDTFTVSIAWQTVFGNADDTMWTEFGYSAAFALDKTNWTLVIDFPGEPPTGTFFCIHIDQHIVGGGTYKPGGGVVYEYEKTIRISF